MTDDIPEENLYTPDAKNAIKEYGAVKWALLSLYCGRLDNEELREKLHGHVDEEHVPEGASEDKFFDALIREIRLRKHKAETNVRYGDTMGTYAVDRSNTSGASNFRITYDNTSGHSNYTVNTENLERITVDITAGDVSDG